MIVLIKLFLAHLVGDFLLQPLSWVRAKEEKKLIAWQLYAHALVHGILIMVLIWNWKFVTWACILTAIHLVIDAGKSLLQTNRNQRWLFFLDQVMHFISIYAVWLWFENKYISLSFLNDEKVILLITFIILLTRPVSIAVKIFISKWTPDTSAGDDVQSLQSAGQYIGILERLLVFVFMIMNEWQAVGFLLAAKSVFRFGNLQKAKDKKLTEYILIGTLLSFSIAVFAGVAYRIMKSYNFT